MEYSETQYRKDMEYLKTGFKKMGKGNLGSPEGQIVTGTILEVKITVSEILELQMVEGLNLRLKRSSEEWVGDWQTCEVILQIVRGSDKGKWRVIIDGNFGANLTADEIREDYELL